MPHGDRISKPYKRQMEASDRIDTSKRVKDSNAEYSKGNREGHDPSREKENQSQAAIIEHGDSNSVRATASDHALSIYDRSRTSMWRGKNSREAEYNRARESTMLQQEYNASLPERVPGEVLPPDKKLQGQDEKLVNKYSKELKGYGILLPDGQVNKNYSLPSYDIDREKIIKRISNMKNDLNQMIQRTTTTTTFLDLVSTCSAAISDVIRSNPPEH